MGDPFCLIWFVVLFPVTEVQTLLAGLDHAMLPIRGKYGESSDIQVSRMDSNWSKYNFGMTCVYFYIYICIYIYVYSMYINIYIYIQMLMCIYSKQLKFVALSFDLPKACWNTGDRRSWSNRTPSTIYGRTLGLDQVTSGKNKNLLQAKLTTAWNYNPKVKSIHPADSWTINWTISINL